MKYFWFYKVRAAFFLGIFNVLHVVVYRLQVKLLFFVYRLPIRSFNLSDVCFGAALKKYNTLNSFRGELLLKKRYSFFFNRSRQVILSPPNWFVNYISGDDWQSQQKVHWSRIAYFPKSGNDIKCIWELSRFYWLVDLAIAYQNFGKQQYLNLAQSWLYDWCQKNPINQGVNWLCAQEAAIRLSNFILAVEIFDIEPNCFVKQFIFAHLNRILPTLHYAKAQCNNHATSEAVGLFVGALWLHAKAPSSRLLKIILKAERLLKANVSQLIQSDGTFSQYSVTYHRMILDALSLAICFQKKYRPLKPLGITTIHCYRLAYQWLLNMVDQVSGDAPNLGSNDGTLFIKLDNCDYRDFRPTLQLASCLLDACRLYEIGEYDQALKLLYPEALKFPMKPVNCKRSIEMAQGGYVFFKAHCPKHWALLNYPSFRFRPSQSDGFHLDIWVNGTNIFLDSGTYSYNAPKNEPDLSSVKAHNTVELDDHEQMPRLSRFLWGEWQKTSIQTPLCQEADYLVWDGQIEDYCGCVHQRKVIASFGGYKIIDTLSSFQSNAVLRWHTKILTWVEQRDHSWLSEGVRLRIEVEGEALPIRCDDCEISPYYWKKIPAKVFSIELKRPPAKIVTYIEIE